MSSPYQHELWQQEARRLGGESLVQVIIEIREGQHEIVRRLGHIEKQHEASERAITLLNTAFAGNDFDGHRRYHELMIASLEERRKLRIAVQEKTISGLVWALIVFIALAVWSYVKIGTNR